MRLESDPVPEKGWLGIEEIKETEIEGKSWGQLGLLYSDMDRNNDPEPIQPV